MKLLFENSIVLNENRFYGAVYEAGNDTYLFRHMPNDLYFYLKKGENGWYEAEGGQSFVEYPDEVIQGVGAEIDEFSNNAN